MKIVSGLFALAIAWGAALLFMCQPMLTKLILPSYGGSPSVWATATFLFQLLLLVGYALVHVTASRLGRRQLPLQLLLVVLPLLVLPLALPEDAAPSSDVDPVWWLIRTLMLAIGLPFVVLATTGPVLQLWYSWTGLRVGQDPYILYAASNAGSLIGLLSYPFLIEWTLPLSAQTRWWSIGYVGYVLLMVGCGAAVWRARRGATIPAPTSTPAAEIDGDGPLGAAGDVDARRRLRWLFWAFLPAGVSLGVTTHLTTDVAAIPLLWVLPLALYLLTFIVAFGQRRRVAPSWPVLLATMLALGSLILALPRLQTPVLVDVTLGLALVFMTGMAGHSRLAADRPAVRHLTGFYLVVSIGGLLGGVLNGVVAPLLFNGPWEYALQLALIPLLAVGLRLPVPRARVLTRFGTLGWVLEVLVVVGAVTVVVKLWPEAEWAVLTSVVLGLAWVTSGLMVVAVPRVFAGLACTLLVVAAAVPLLRQDAAWRDRTFFGSYEIEVAGERHILTHGTTIHGWQEWPGGSADPTPTTYYSRSGPLGDIMASAPDAEPRSLGFVGLGIGTALAYVGPEDTADVVEIDQVIVDVASDTRWFSYLDAAGPDVDVHVGDGRLVLQDELPDATFDVLVVDAFSSDAIPVHLLTREALALYLDRLDADGVIALHVSNRHLDLVSVAAALAGEAGVAAAFRVDVQPVEDSATSSTWIVLSRADSRVEGLLADGWQSLAGREGPLWTDDYSSVVSVLR